jgi:hypothetical protein
MLGKVDKVMVELGMMGDIQVMVAHNHHQAGVNQSVVNRLHRPRLLLKLHKIKLHQHVQTLVQLKTVLWLRQNWKMQKKKKQALPALVIPERQMIPNLDKC